MGASAELKEAWAGAERETEKEMTVVPDSTALLTMERTSHVVQPGVAEIPWEMVEQRGQMGGRSLEES